MRLLLDTHVLIWTVGQPDRVPDRVREMMIAEHAAVYVSSATAWEIATKVRNRKLEFDAGFLAEFDDRLRGHQFQPLHVTSQHAIRGASLPGRHKDPFDRLLAGQALCEGLTIATVDMHLAGLGAPVFW